MPFSLPIDRRLWPLAPPGIAVALLVLLSAWPGAAGAGPSARLFVGVVLVAAGAAAHRPLGGTTLGLGAVVLPLVLAAWPAAWAGWAAAAALGLRDAVARLAVRNGAGRDAGGSSPLAALGDFGAAIAGVLAGSAAWALASPTTEPSAGWPTAALAALGAYLGVAAAVRLALARSEGGNGDWIGPLRPLAVDLAGGLAGCAILAAWYAAGWRLGLPLAAVVAALSLEAARNARREGLALRRAAELRDATLAGHRIIFGTSELDGIAAQLHHECRRIVAVSWFQFEMVAGQTHRSWQAGPEGGVSEGVPTPPPRPPALPGIHRRHAWRVIERRLGTEEEELARLRIWCDPRKIHPGSLELLDALLPQMTSAVERSLLDRQARRDPLTDLPDRRELEERLELTFAASRERGRPMAVIMCDLDHFKRINDLNGHAVGDQALIEIARVLEAHRREGDLCCRYGGEEFALVLEGSDGDTAIAVAERLRRAVEELRPAEFDTRIPLRLSAGIASYPEIHVGGPEELVELADEALYEAKRRGRNRSLLHLGGRRYRTADGEVVGEPESGELRAPTLFA